MNGLAERKRETRRADAMTVLRNIRTVGMNGLVERKRETRRADATTALRHVSATK